MRAETLVVGAGQAGLALSWHLTARRQPHVVLERGRVGERWHSERWDSLTLLTPDRLNLLPGQVAPATPDAFTGRAEFAGSLAGYARSFAAPVVEGVEVVKVERAGGGFRVRTDAGTLSAANVVVATGDCDSPRVPALADALPGDVVSLHSASYRRPELLPPGGVLVVGAGPSGQQIARELQLAGRNVVLAAGRHARAPMRYRGRDIWHWLEQTGHLDQTIDQVANLEAARRTPSIPLIGACGGIDTDLGILSALGVVVTGRLVGLDGATVCFADDLAENVAAADRRLRRVLALVDAHVERERFDAPAAAPPGPVELPPPPQAIDLRAHGIGTVVWATGYRREYGWLSVPGVVGADGELVQRKGVTDVPGLYVLGLRFQHRRSSHFIGGVGVDAGELADAICRRAGGEASPAPASTRTARSPSGRRRAPAAADPDSAVAAGRSGRDHRLVQEPPRAGCRSAR